MSISPWAFFMVQKMYEYQKNNNITKMCITNTMYLVDTLNENGHKASAKAVIAVSGYDTDELQIFIHMVVECNGHILDPSYEVHCKDAKYLDKLSAVIQLFNAEEKYSSESLTKKELITQYINFIKFAEKINGRGFIVTDKKYYNAQADYIEKCFKKIDTKKF